MPNYTIGIAIHNHNSNPLFFTLDPENKIVFDRKWVLQDTPLNKYMKRLK